MMWRSVSFRRYAWSPLTCASAYALDPPPQPSPSPCFSPRRNRLPVPPLPVSQEAKTVPALNRSLDLVTFATLIRPLVDTRTEAGASRALRLWAEMHARGVAADSALVGTMITACERTPSLGAEVQK
jgi:hypothetical protein